MEEIRVYKRWENLICFFLIYYLMFNKVCCSYLDLEVIGFFVCLCVCVYYVSLGLILVVLGLYFC